MDAGQRHTLRPGGEYQIPDGGKEAYSWLSRVSEVIRNVKIDDFWLIGLITYVSFDLFPRAQS